MKLASYPLVIMAYAIVVALCLVQFAWSSLALERVVYMLPEDHPFTQCPVENCYNLTALLSHDLLLGDLSNTTIALLPGIHTCSSAVNRVVSINSATNFTLRAANSSAGATITCNGSIGFEFGFCSNLMIVGITFKECGAYQTINNFLSYYPLDVYFTLYQFYSSNIYINKVKITSGRGIGLLVANIQDQITLTSSHLADNEGNFYFLNQDNKDVTSNYTVLVRIVNSYISGAKTIHSYNNHRLNDVYDRGVTLRLQQSRHYTQVEIINTTLSQNSINIHAWFISCRNNIKIDGLRSTGKKSVSSFRSTFASICTASTIKEKIFTIQNTHFVGGELKFLGSKKQILHWITLSNVQVESLQKSMTLEQQNVVLRNTVFQDNHDAICIENNHQVYIQGELTYQRNYLGLKFITQSNITIDKNSIIRFKHNNVHSSESPFYTFNSNIQILENSSITFENNTGAQSGGITLVNSFVTFKGSSHLIFSQNSGKRGGAMAFYSKSQLIVHAGITNLTFVENHATVVGGAIFVQDSDYVTESGYQKFFAIVSYKASKPNFFFSNNTAIQAGDSLYGGSGNNNDLTFNNSVNSNWSLGSTEPFKVCKCVESKPQCSSVIINTDLLPGQTFNIEVVAVGYWDGTVPSNIQAQFEPPTDGKIAHTQLIQSVGRQCTKLSYTIYFSKEHERLQLQTVTNERNVKPKKLYVNFFRQNCTTGLSFNNMTKSCVCNPILSKHGIQCDVQTQKIKRLSPQWIYATYIHLNLIELSGVIVHDHCPFDYCVPTDGVAQSLDLLNSDEQCSFNRSGILCGACQTNFSHCLLYTSPSPRDATLSRMPSSA